MKYMMMMSFKADKESMSKSIATWPKPDVQAHIAFMIDGVFPESKEFLIGYWIIDVETPERACQLAARASAAPGRGGIPLNMPIEVRQIMGGPPEEFQ